MQSTGSCKIIGIGAYLPQNIVTSYELMLEIGSKKFGVSPNFLSRFSGINERRFSKEECPSDMAIAASREAINEAQIDVKDIDLIIFCGIDRDYAEPSTAHRIQFELGAENAECFDVTNACHGIMNGVSIANAYINFGSAENVLICTGEKPSQITLDVMHQLKDTNDKTLFKRLLGALTVGDAGGAFILTKSKSKEEGFQWMNFQSAGKYMEYCYYKYHRHGLEFQMLMEEIANAAVGMHQDMINSTYQNLGWKPESISKVYCHQAGEKPHIKMANLAKQPLAKAPTTYNKYGNLTSATIPVNMALHRPNKGEKVLILGVGSGLSISQTGLVF